MSFLNKKTPNSSSKRNKAVTSSGKKAVSSSNQPDLTSGFKVYTLINDPNPFSKHLMPDRNQQLLFDTTIKRSMQKRHYCLLCSTVLLRHMRAGGLYWRCSHCHEEMPIV
ncbi:hypothetical protein [Stenomitos frigidus]|uniref:hypothetical protein n=1 Tax=Stenomitos frigidus TaxID=1886765 RepID=UPI0011B218C7|nr:hypothetical protein [Stenomitos frigidus]